MHRIRIAPAESAFVQFDAAPREVALYPDPGTVPDLRRTVSPIRVLYGQAIRLDGTPIANARIDGGLHPAATDAFGYFQVEVGCDHELMLVRSGAPFCRVDLPTLAADQDYVAVGTVTCRRGKRGPPGPGTRERPGSAA